MLATSVRSIAEGSQTILPAVKLVHDSFGDIKPDLVTSKKIALCILGRYNGPAQITYWAEGSLYYMDIRFGAEL